MQGIYLTAVLTTSVAVMLFGVLIHKQRLPVKERVGSRDCFATSAAPLSLDSNALARFGASARAAIDAACKARDRTPQTCSRTSLVEELLRIVEAHSF